MSAELKDLAGRIAKAYPEGGARVAQIADELEALGLIPHRLSIEGPQDRLEAALREYKTRPLTPELVTQTHRAIWQVRGEIVGARYEVTPCPYTQEDIARLEQSDKRVGYLPPQLATQQSRYILGEMFPEMRDYSVQIGNPVTNDGDPSGWFDYEAAIYAPHLGINGKELRKRVKKDGRELLSLNQYIVAGQDSKLFTGRYLDEVEDEVRTWARLGSRRGKLAVYANFGLDGSLGVHHYLPPSDRSSHLGGRSAGVKRT